MTLTLEKMEELSNQATFRKFQKQLKESPETKGWTEDAINRTAFNLARLKGVESFEKFMATLVSF